MNKITLILIFILFILLGGILLFETRELSRIKNEHHNYKLEIVELTKKFNEVNELYGNIVANKYCTPCHNKYKTDNFLEGIVDKVGERYFKLYLTKQDSLIAAKDDYAVRAKVRYGNLANIHNFKLSDNELKTLSNYFR